MKKEAQNKHDREEAREAAQKALEHVSTRAKVEVADEFCEKRFLIRLEQLIENRPFDISNLRLEVTTVKGARQKAPPYVSFTVTSEQQGEVGQILADVKKLVHDVGLAYVSRPR